MPDAQRRSSWMWLVHGFSCRNPILCCHDFVSYCFPSSFEHAYSDGLVLNLSLSIYHWTAHFWLKTYGPMINLSNFFPNSRMETNGHQSVMDFLSKKVKFNEAKEEWSSKLGCTILGWKRMKPNVSGVMETFTKKSWVDGLKFISNLSVHLDDHLGCDPVSGDEISQAWIKNDIKQTTNF